MSKVKFDTIVRTIALVLALVNQALAIFGKEKLPFTEDEIYQIASLLMTFITSIIAWWKNNSFTPAAIKADEVLKQEKINNYFK